MNGTTNLAVVDLSPCGFVFKEFSLESLILNEFLNFWIFDDFTPLDLTHCRNHNTHYRNHYTHSDFKGGTPGLYYKG